MDIGIGGQTARDLMQPNVVTLPPEARLSEALALFEDESISGIPIVAQNGDIVGVLSEHDVARPEHMRKGRIDPTSGAYDFSGDEEATVEDADYYGKEDYSPELLGEELVKDWMNPAVVGVPPEADVKTVCATMVREGVHRVMVLHGRRLVGIISSMDVVKAVAQG
jgi:CBS domain-containing protein